MPIDPLTIEEEKARFSLERKVERAFYEAGTALRELRDRRLYRSTHVTFEEYCRERFDFTRRRPYQLIEAAQIYDNLIDKCEPIAPVLPTKEGQVRPLSELNTEEQPIAWEAAVKQAGGKVPTGRIVNDVVKRMKDIDTPAAGRGGFLLHRPVTRSNNVSCSLPAPRSPQVFLRCDPASAKDARERAPR